jgi:Domain of unknown function (DUF4157)
VIYVKREKADRAAWTNVSLPQRINARGPLASEARSRGANTPAHPRAELTRLQRTVGNLAVLRRLALREQEAAPERVAEPPRPALPTSGGRPLPQSTRGTMESFFNTDFSAVRVHEGPQAAAIGALAFASGNDLHFAPGQYNPQSTQGQQLLGHELTHVVQQRAGRVRNPLCAGVAVVQDTVLEAEADRMGLRAAAQVGGAGVSFPAGGESETDSSRTFSSHQIQCSFRSDVVQPGVQPGKKKPSAHSKSKSKYTVKKGAAGVHKPAAKKGKKFTVKQSATGDYVVKGRPEFMSQAKKIKVKRTIGSLQDRRHIIPFHRLRDVITKAATLYEQSHGEVARRTEIERLITLCNYTKTRGDSVESLIKVANSNPRNLFPEDASENQAIEIIRKAARGARKDLDELYKTEDPTEDPALDTLKDTALSHFLVDTAAATSITTEMNKIRQIVRHSIVNATKQEEIFEIIKWAERSTELDLVKASGSKDLNSAALDINNRMTHYIQDVGNNLSTSGEDGFKLVEKFFKM